MKKLITLILTITFLGAVAGCAHDNLIAPCPDFGSGCSKAPINTWDYSS